jgi:hypothetical protein
VYSVTLLDLRDGISCACETTVKKWTGDDTSLKLSLSVKHLGDFFKKKCGSMMLQVEKHFGTDLCG